MLRAQARIGMSLNHLLPGCKNTWETLPPSKWELASNDLMTGRMRLLLCGLMTLKRLVCLYACGWSPKMNLRLQKEAEILRPRNFFVNTSSKIVFLQFLLSSKSSHSNCDAICQLYSWIRVREIFWNKLLETCLFFPFLFQFTYSCKVCNCVVCSEFGK